jgi:hypothetical protein
MAFYKEFSRFYNNQFTAEHQNSLNIFMHVFGTVGSAVFLIWALTSTYWWLALLYPAVHALPGLLGHRLFEKSPELGNLRINRTDFPLWWFIIANHILTAKVAKGLITRNGSKQGKTD